MFQFVFLATCQIFDRNVRAKSVPVIYLAGELLNLPIMKSIETNSKEKNGNVDINATGNEKNILSATLLTLSESQ
jgi:hypothetical protein